MKLKFSTVALPKPGPMYAFAVDANELWVGGQAYNHGCLFSSKDGERFVRYSMPELWNSLGAGILPTLDGEVLVAGWYGIKRSSKRTRWPKDSPADSSWCLLRAKDNVIWSGGESSAQWSTDDGKTWKSAGKSATPIYALVETAEGIVGLGATCSMLGRSRVKVRKKLPQTVRGAAVSPGGQYLAVGDKGLILRSENGLDWKRVTAPTKEDLYGVAWCGDRFLFGGDNKMLFSLQLDGTLRREKFVTGRRLDIKAIAQFRGRVFVCALAPPRDIAERLKEGTEGAGVLVTSGDVAKVEPLDASKFCTAPRRETAAQALERYQRFLDAICAAQLINDERSWRQSHEPYFYKPLVTTGELAKVEKRLGITLPPSYRAFVTKFGRFSFGKDRNEGRLLTTASFDRLDAWIGREWNLDLEDDADVKPGDMKYLHDTIPFSNGDHGLQLVWFYSFRVDAQRADGECPIVPFDQDEIAAYAKPVKTFRKPPQTFDEHISRLVTEKIVELAEEYLGASPAR